MQLIDIALFIFLWGGWATAQGCVIRFLELQCHDPLSQESSKVFPTALLAFGPILTFFLVAVSLVFLLLLFIDFVVEAFEK